MCIALQVPAMGLWVELVKLLPPLADDEMSDVEMLDIVRTALERGPLTKVRTAPRATHRTTPRATRHAPRTTRHATRHAPRATHLRLPLSLPRTLRLTLRLPPKAGEGEGADHLAKVKAEKAARLTRALEDRVHYLEGHKMLKKGVAKSQVLTRTRALTLTLTLILELEPELELDPSLWP